MLLIQFSYIDFPGIARDFNENGVVIPTSSFLLLLIDRQQFAIGYFR